MGSFVAHVPKFHNEVCWYKSLYSPDWALGRTFSGGLFKLEFFSIGQFSCTDSDLPSIVSVLSGTPINYWMLEDLYWFSNFNFKVIVIPGHFPCISLLSAYRGSVFLCLSYVPLGDWYFWCRVLSLHFIDSGFFPFLIFVLSRDRRDLCFWPS